MVRVWIAERQGTLGTLALLIWLIIGFFRLLPPYIRQLGFNARHLPPHYYGWSFSHLAYSDILALYDGRHLALHLLPLLQNAIEYPVIMDWTMWVASLAHGILGYFVVTALILALSGVLSLWALRKVAPHHYWAFALSPLLLVYGLLNWDLLGILWMALSWWAYDRHRPALTGLLLALGASTKLFPIVAWPFMVYGWWLAGKRGDAVRLSGVALASLLVINVPFAWANWANWARFITYNSQRRPAGDLWVLFWPHIATHTVDWLSLVLVLLLAIWALRQIASGITPAMATSWVFLGWMIVNKVFSPQYMLWVLAFAVLGEWPLWTMAILTVGGLGDYWNSFTALMYHTLYPIQAPTRVWFFQTVFPWGQGFRYLTLAVAGFSAWLAVWTLRGSSPTQKLELKNRQGTTEAG